LFRRFPRLRPRPVSLPVIDERSKHEYPELAADFAALRRVETEFRKHDLRALRAQNTYRLQEIAVLAGATLLTCLGGLQAILSHQRWPSITLALIGIAMAGAAQFIADDSLLPDYFLARVKAERLRALYFTYLARAEPFTGEDREDVLEQAIDAIDEGEELT
jgi:hypothetical protein